MVCVVQGERGEEKKHREGNGGDVSLEICVLSKVQEEAEREEKKSERDERMCTSVECKENVERRTKKKVGRLKRRGKEVACNNSISSKKQGHQKQEEQAERQEKEKCCVYVSVYIKIEGGTKSPKEAKEKERPATAHPPKRAALLHHAFAFPFTTPRPPTPQAQAQAIVVAPPGAAAAAI